MVVAKTNAKTAGRFKTEERLGCDGGGVSSFFASSFFFLLFAFSSVVWP